MTYSIYFSKINSYQCTEKKPERLSCQVPLEKLTIKHMTVNEKAMWKRITGDSVKEGCLQNDPQSSARGAGSQLVSVSGVHQFRMELV